MKGFEDVPADWSPVTIWVTDNGPLYQKLQFIVAGQPIQQGNMITGRYGNLYDKTKGLRPWRDMVSWAAKAAMNGGYRIREPSATIIIPVQCTGTTVLSTKLDLFDGPVALEVDFVRRRPKGMPKKITPPHTKFPDLDKLLRAVADSLSGIVFHDDAQIVEHHCFKRYADVGETPGIHVTVTNIPET